MSRFTRYLSGLSSRTWILLGLATLTIAVYAQVGWHSFVNYDDTNLISANPRVFSGLTWENVVWAFTATSGVSFWQPLTWLSHMADVEIFGLNAGGHHLMSAAIHAVNAMLLFLVLARMTGATWRSGFVAALFAVHPLHVESVAWAAERKDVLSTLFLFLTLWTYARYAERPGLGRYAWVALFFGMSLMSKPMGVTLPFVLLLLDGWPLSRIEGVARGTDHGTGAFPAASWKRLLWEKAPLLVMAAGSAYMTLQFKGEASWVASSDAYPVPVRAANAVVSYATYLWKTVWPTSLAMFYPHPASIHASIPGWKIAGAIVLLGGISFLALRQVRRRPHIAVGWLWFLGTLVPVIGIIQASTQAMADRFTYIPLIGVFLMVTWEGASILEGWRCPRLVIGSIAGGIVLALTAASVVQTGYWKDSITLSTRAIEVTENNYVAWNCLGRAYQDLGLRDKALEAFRESIRIYPNYHLAMNNIGVIYASAGEYEKAMGAFQEVLRIRPDHVSAWNNIGRIYFILGQYSMAINAQKEALARRPMYYLSWKNLGDAYAGLNQYEQAIAAYQEALRIKPDYAEAQRNLIAARGKAGKIP